MARYSVKDRVAFAGMGSTGFVRDIGNRSQASLAIEAAKAAIRDAGLSASDIDGLCGTLPEARVMASALGLPKLVWFSNHLTPLGFSIIDAMNAIHSGLCDTVLVYHSTYRSPAVSRSAATDPFRRNLGVLGRPPVTGRRDPETVVGHAAWASRYMAEYDVPKEHFGYVAINNRTNAADNPRAVRRDPLTMENYLTARIVRAPLCLFDMDIPVDGADAFVLTTAERAKDLPQPPVLIHAATAGLIDRNEEDQLPSLQHHGQHVVIESLRAKSDIWIPDIDLFYPYDGFTIITLSWIENLGWCCQGEGGEFLADHWNKSTKRVLINGRIPLNSHGGSLSEGATQGSGHIREAITQIRGQAGNRQVPGAMTALLLLGGLFYNAQGLVFRAE